MPGLFGIIVMEGASASPDTLATLFQRMGDALKHYDDERIDTWIESEQVYLARVGLPHVHTVPWPRDGTSAFIAGVLHDENWAIDAAPSDDALLRSMRGFHVAILHDSRRTLLAADRHASLPMYYAEVDGLLLFAPEIKAILCHPALSRELDKRALASFIVSGFLPRELTLLAKVRRLRGGQALRIENGRARLIEYWRYRPAARAGTHSRRDLEEMLGDLVEQATVRNLGDPRKTVLFLSGGFDSRAILGAALKTLGGDVRSLQTVCWGKDRGAGDSDVAVAQRLAAALGLKHWFIQRSTDDYAERFREVNDLIDAQSEIAAFHPHEYAIMKELRGHGFERVLRGDECFGYSYHVSSFTGALAVIWMHRLRDAVNGRDFILPEAFADLCDASDAAIDATLAEVEGMAPDDAKDYFYFSHRVQGYLNSASYYKRCLLDQRNVFLDEAFLDFLELVPAKWRIDKNLFCSAVRRRFPDLYRLPMARRHNLEDWAELLGKTTALSTAAGERGRGEGGSPVRDFALRQVADEDSGIWQWFDRHACSRFLEGLSAHEGKPARGGWRSALRALFLKMPRWLQAPVQAWKASRPAFRLAPEYVLLRILTIKDWYDRLCAGRDRMNALVQAASVKGGGWSEPEA